MPDDGAAFQLDPDSTWIRSVEQFEADAAAWLTAADAPQLMALRKIAKQLDDGTFQAALISQFTLIHRALLSRRPDENDGSGKPPTKTNGGMFEFLGGRWSADQFPDDGGDQ